LRQTSTVVFCAVDSLVPVRGKIQAGFDEFCMELEHASIPMVWTTSRSRLQMDEALRKLGHRHPFITEDGCGAYIPEGYYNLRSEKVVRFGRFTCIPVADMLPAATEALELVSEESGVPVVALKSLSPRELAQNVGLPEREAELTRQRDFDAPFFFAGATDEDIDRFRANAAERKFVLHQHGVMWSLSVGGDVTRCVRELSTLYQRVLRFRPAAVAMATPDESADLFPAGDRKILLTRQSSPQADPDAPPAVVRAREHWLGSPDVWEGVLAEIKAGGAGSHSHR
jgi:predicted mannosyl-3-phosphoglycerate phosphatase (HAD superfamily)